MYTMIVGIEAQKDEMKPETVDPRRDCSGYYESNTQAYWQAGVYTDKHHLNTGVEVTERKAGRGRK